MEIISLDIGSKLVPFDEALAVQRKFHADVVSGTRPNTILAVEHPSVYTAGRRTRQHERPSPPLSATDVDRGGKITWHGPGQLVLYPIVRLPHPLDVVAYVRTIEEAVMDTCSEFGVPTHQEDGRSGVWVSARGHGYSKKICAIGVRVSQGVTMHGLALNCSNSLEPYAHITPCGLADAAVTTLTTELDQKLTPQDVSEPATRHLVGKFRHLGIQ